MKDIDGNIYSTVKIGNQIWMTENLKVTHYSNGDPIFNVTGESEWENLKTGAYCNYDNKAGNSDTYGRLYNWYAVNDIRKIAPKGWHVPTDEECKELEIYLGMSRNKANEVGGSEDKRGTNEGRKLKERGTDHWDSSSKGTTNSSGFSALPGGEFYFYRSSGRVYCGFRNMGDCACFWSSTVRSNNYVWNRELWDNEPHVYRRTNHKRSGISVRCVKD